MRKMGIGLGVGINRSNYAQGIFNAYSARVVADGGVVESGNCVNAVSSLLQSASLLLIPSGYKGGKLYSEIPTNGNGDLTWTRGSDAFRTNASGLIQRMPWNLLQRSEEFNNAIWTKNATTITADAILAPNGTLTADKLVETATSSTHWVFQSTTYTSASQTVSCYMKKGERNFGFIRTRTATTDLFAWFNLNTGALGTVESGITASITNVGDGWYRCVVVNPNPTTSANPSVIGLSNADNVSTYTGDGTSGIYIWGAQLVEGTTAQTYLPTTDRLNFPRLSYMYGSCPSALLEPQRTNLALYSSSVGGTGWTMAFAGIGVIPTVTTNYAVGPDGTTSASRLQLSLGGGITTLDQSLVTQTLTGTSCRGSFYIKTNDGSTKTIYMRGSGASSVVIDGTWKRYDFDAATLSTTQFGIGLRGGQTPTNSNTADILVWGAQLEPNAAYPTTYIPTTSATATRVADSFSRSNIYTNGLISASGGTWFVELRGNVAYTRDGSLTQSLFVADTTSGFGTNGFAFLAGLGNGTLLLYKTVASAVSLIYTTTTSTTKIAIKWNGTTADVFANGTKVVSATSFTGTNMQNLGGNGNDVPKFIQQMALFPTPLSDTDCTTLTTL